MSSSPTYVRRQGNLHKHGISVTPQQESSPAHTYLLSDANQQRGNQMQATFDVPATDKELDGFWGVPAADDEWTEVCERQTAAYDKEDLDIVVDEFSGAILAALKANNLQQVGEIFAIARATTIARRVSMELTGKAA